MLRKNRHIIVLFLVANLLVSNVGLSVNWLYCFCKGQMQVSLFSLEENCKTPENGQDDCCQTAQCKIAETEVKSCCKKFQKYRHAEKPCTQKGTKYLKADLKFFLSEKNNITPKHIDFDAPMIAPLESYVSSYYNTYFYFPSLCKVNSPPFPSKHGRSLLCFIQNFRC
jgi:hypothetical protein